jgi:2'-5' RNA ligase
MASELYFLAILPPPDIQAEVTCFKEVARDRFQARRALNSPPHITLIPPFRWPASRHSEVVDLVRGFNAELQAFPVRLRGFAAFPPRVIFVDVVPSATLASCQQKLEVLGTTQLGLPDDRRYGFHAHMTIAFKDLKRKVFPAAWAYFEALSYDAQFLVREVQLLRFRDGRWRLV